MDRATRKQLFNRCRPDEPLEPGDPRCLDVDALAGNVRGGSWAEGMARRIALSDGPVCARLTAQPGAGVTTELLRLGERLRAEQRLLVVHIDAREVIDLSNPVSVADLLLAVMQRTEAAVARMRGVTVEAPVRRLRRWLADVGVGLDRPAENLRSNVQARARLRANVEAELSSFVAEVQGELVIQENGARLAGFNGIAVLFDGLERQRGLSTNWREVLDSGEHAFSSDALLLPVHVVWTVPSALLLRPSVAVEHLPMIALADRSGERHEPGLEAGARLIWQRVPAALLPELFGAEMFGARLIELIEASGGSPQEMVGPLQHCIAEAPVDDRRFAQILSARGELWQRPVMRNQLAWLARVRDTKSIDAHDEEERFLAERALLDGLVVRYQCDEGAWYDLRPPVLRMI